jgi:hypothetical protein
MRIQSDCAAIVQRLCSDFEVIALHVQSDYASFTMRLRHVRATLTKRSTNLCGYASILLLFRCYCTTISSLSLRDCAAFTKQLRCDFVTYALHLCYDRAATSLRLRQIDKVFALRLRTKCLRCLQKAIALRLHRSFAGIALRFRGFCNVNALRLLAGIALRFHGFCNVNALRLHRNFTDIALRF